MEIKCGFGLIVNCRCMGGLFPVMDFAQLNIEFFGEAIDALVEICGAHFGVEPVLAAAQMRLEQKLLAAVILVMIEDDARAPFMGGEVFQFQEAFFGVIPNWFGEFEVAGADFDFHKWGRMGWFTSGILG